MNRRQQTEAEECVGMGGRGEVLSGERVDTKHYAASVAAARSSGTCCSTTHTSEKVMTSSARSLQRWALVYFRAHSACDALILLPLSIVGRLMELMKQKIERKNGRRTATAVTTPDVLGPSRL